MWAGPATSGGAKQTDKLTTAGYISTFMRKGFSFPMGMLLKRFEAGAVSSEGHYGGNGAFRAKA